MNGLFELGRVVATARVFQFTNENSYFNTFVGFCMTLYISGNWGVLAEEDWRQNDLAVADGDRIMASYPIPMDLRDQVDGEEKLWIITEGDRSVTTLLFPDEY